MSEEILKALMQLFGIIAKQDGGVEDSERTYVQNFLRQQIGEQDLDAYLALFDKKAQSRKKKSKLREEKEKTGERLTSVGDSVKTLGIAKKINKTLSQKQKIVVLVRLYELVNSDRKFTEQRMAIILTVAEVFNISAEETQEINNYVISAESEVNLKNVLVYKDAQKPSDEDLFSILLPGLGGDITILRIQSTDLYFVKYVGFNSIMINGLPMAQERIYLLANGSTIRFPKGKPLYYSDVVARFQRNTSKVNISFQAQDIYYQFPNGNWGLQNISIEEEQGKLLGIMGASGAGKTTLMNIMSGLIPPTKGQVLINGIDLFKDKKQLEGVVGYIPQDDLLIEELTVYQNLFYNAKLCFKDHTKEAIDELVNKTLKALELYDRKDLKVGNALNKSISGGQRKRLNIALELIREPSVLFVDEPTSGLSSKDSENVMDLLRELSLKGKLIFVVIHQPSSDIYKMFDRMVILDTGGHLIYSGNPVEAVMYFKKIDAQVNSNVGECHVCGNVNTELIFNIIEAKIVDEYGNYLDKRKIKPERWSKFFKEERQLKAVKTIREQPEKSLSIPGWLAQVGIFFKRDFWSKISNAQYITLNVLEAPLLGFFLAYIIRYIADPHSGSYIYRENENIPPYIFMTIVVALFLGMMVSAEEIFKDRKILKREKLLNLSRSSYLLSKIGILFSLSALQMFLFVMIGNTILGIEHMTFEYWMVLFSVASFANMLGLIISSTFNSVVTIYIIIPLILIPQMILGGAMFSFDKLNRNIGSVEKVPVVAEFIASKWAYEALMVNQFVNNEYEKHFYELDQAISVANFKQIYYLPELNEKLEYCRTHFQSEKDRAQVETELSLLKNEFEKEHYQLPDLPIEDFVNQLDIDSLSLFATYQAKNTLEKLNKYYSKMFRDANTKRDKTVSWMMSSNAKLYKRLKNNHRNDAVTDIVKNIYEKNQVIRYNDDLIQQSEPIFLMPRNDQGYLNFRTHFYAPKKFFAGQYYNTLYFNILMIWLMTAFCYLCLYFDVFKKLVVYSGKFDWGKSIQLRQFFSIFRTIKLRK